MGETVVLACIYDAQSISHLSLSCFRLSKPHTHNGCLPNSPSPNGRARYLSRVKSTLPEDGWLAQPLQYSLKWFVSPENSLLGTSLNLVPPCGAQVAYTVASTSCPSGPTIHLPPILPTNIAYHSRQETTHRAVSGAVRPCSRLSVSCPLSDGKGGTGVSHFHMTRFFFFPLEIPSTLLGGIAITWQLEEEGVTFLKLQGENKAGEARRGLKERWEGRGIFMGEERGWRGRDR